MFNLIGKTLGPYRILEQIGAGGMATVYKAYQPSMDRYIAIKILPLQLSQDELFVKRFQREAHAIAKLEHAHILPVFDYGESEGITYIAMRYIPAGTLKEYLVKGRLPLDEIARLIGQIASALEYAHQQGVIHRDVKPGNVLMDEQGNTYLTDFGLARMLESSQQITGSGVGVGTPAYMAPEQGMGGKVDHRSDIYSLGVVLYEMVTGHVPYEAETPMAVVLKHITEPLPLPRTIAPNVPEAVELVILKALAKEPAHRYQSVGELAEALAAAVRKSAGLDVKPIPAPQPVAVQPAPVSAETIPQVTRKSFWQKQRGWLMLLGGTLVVLAAFGLIFSRFWRQKQAVAPEPTAIAIQSTATPVLSPTLTPPPTVTVLGGNPGPIAPAAPCRIAFVKDDGDIYVRNCDGSGEHQVTQLKSVFNLGSGPLSWSPDGQYIVFQSIHERPPGNTDPLLYLIKADGSNLTSLTSDNNDKFNHHDKFPAWSPDGQRIAFDHNCSLVTIAPDGSGWKTIVPGPDEETGVCPNTSAWSPDGKQLAFVSWHDPYPESKKYILYIVNSDGTNLRKLWKFESGGMPSWSPDGKQIGFENWGGSQVAYLLNADGSGEPAKVSFIPDAWHAWYWPQWGFKKVGMSGALWLDGKTGYVSIPYSESMYISQAITIEAWVNYVPRAPKKCGDGAGYCNFMPIISQSNPSSSIGSYILAVDGGAPVFGFEPASIGDVLYRTETLMNDGWHHLAVIHTFGQSSKTQILLDGQPIPGRWINGNRANQAPYNLARSPFRIGYLTVGPEAYFQGMIDELRLWNVARTPDEIRAAMNVELTGNEPGLAGYWQFDEPADATIARDSSPNDNNGTLQGDAHIRSADAPLQPAAATSGNSQAEQAHAFAEPILKAIADRKPDFADDFSAADKGWRGCNLEQNESATIQDGVARLAVSKKDVCFSKTALDGKDFVLQLDGRVVTGDPSTNVIINFHNRSSEFWYYFTMNSSSLNWNVDKRLNGQQPNLVSGQGTINPVGKMTNILIVARGMEAAIYLNNVPAAYFKDADFNTNGYTFLFCGSIAEGVCEFDNVRFWNLANIPGLP